MALRFEKGKRRPQPPRLKDLGKRSGQRSRNQDEGGRFAPGNNAAAGRRVKGIIRRYLGADVTAQELVALTQDTLELFRAFKRALGSEVPQVQDTVARRARWGVLSAFYALKAIELGLLTDAGQAAIEMALKLDARAERLDVTAIDLAERLEPEDDPRAAHAGLLEAFGEPEASTTPPAPANDAGTPTEAEQ